MPAAPAEPAVDYFARIDGAALPPPAPSLFEAARALATGWQPGGYERRRSPRFVLAADALFQPIDTEGRPFGKAFRAVIADFSTDGLRLFHSRSIVARRVAVRFDLSTTITSVVDLCRSARVDGRFEYAGPFVAPLVSVGSDEIASASARASDG